MRSFDERKAEILRRSGERIKKRKRVKRILLTCIPLFACAMLWSAVLFGQQDKRAVTNDSAAPENEYYDEESAQLVFTSVEITEQGIENGYYKRLEKASEISAVENTIDSIISYCESDRDGLSCSDNELKSEVTDAARSDVYEIVFTLSDGSRKVFALNGNVLISNEGAEYTLSDKQLAELKAALGLTD